MYHTIHEPERNQHGGGGGTHAPKSIKPTVNICTSNHFYIYMHLVSSRIKKKKQKEFLPLPILLNNNQNVYECCMRYSDLTHRLNCEWNSGRLKYNKKKTAAPAAATFPHKQHVCTSNRCKECSLHVLVVHLHSMPRAIVRYKIQYFFYYVNGKSFSVFALVFRFFR